MATPKTQKKGEIHGVVGIYFKFKIEKNRWLLRWGDEIDEI